jgi:hypothetical protein
MRYPQSIRQRYVLVGVPAIFPIALAVTDATSTDAGGSSTAEESLSADSEMPAQVRSVLYRACRGCHPKIPSRPWDASVPPISGKIQNDVARGRAIMNMSKWKNYTRAEQRGFALAISTATASHTCRRQSTSGCTVRPGCHRRTWNYERMGGTQRTPQTESAIRMNEDA